MAEEPAKSYFVFISHAGTDTWVAQQIEKHIQASGATTFLDEAHIDVGAEFEEKIQAALNKANELLVLFTPWSLKRPYVWLEIGVAWGRGIPIVGLLHGLSAEELSTQAEVPLVIKRRNLIDINKLDRYFSELAERVENQTDEGQQP